MKKDLIGELLLIGIGVWMFVLVVRCVGVLLGEIARLWFGRPRE